MSVAATNTVTNGGTNPPTNHWTNFMTNTLTNSLTNLGTNMMTNSTTNMTTNPLLVPTININGTTKESLFQNYLSALHAVETARDALHDCAPHGRDYQTAATGAYLEARKQHVLRLGKLESVISELMQILLSIQDQ